MSCALRYPEYSTDLTQSQFLGPLDPKSLNTLKPSTRRRTGRDGRYFETEVVYLDSFRKSLLSFAGQVIDEFHKSKNLRGGVAPVPLKNLSTTSAISYNNTYRSTFVTKRDFFSPIPSQNSRRSRSQSQTRAPSLPRKCLKPPRPRFSSPLSPNAPGTILEGCEERRPIPSTRRKEEILYRVVLEKTVAVNGGTPFVRMAKSKTISAAKPQTTSVSDSDRYRHGRDRTSMMPHPSTDSNKCGGGFGLGSSWVVIPRRTSWDVVRRKDIIM